MPYTAAQLNQYYLNLSRGAQPDAATATAINTAAAQDANGTITDAQALSVVLNSNQIRATTDVAVATYALFTGTTPSQAGIDYLVNNPGSGYNTSYYNGAGGTAASPGAGGFNTANRYYNAAINLAATPGAAGNGAFVQQYSGLTLQQTVITAYNQIIGVASVGQSAADAGIAAITAAIPYFQQVARERAGSTNQDIATKAIIVSYILEEGIKADVGVYARALDQFNFALASGTGTFNSNLLTTFGPNSANFNPTITPLVDQQTFAGATGANATLTTVGVAAGATGTVTLGANATIAFTGDIATNNGQLVANVANASTNAADVLNLMYSGQTISTAPSVIAAGVETINLNAMQSSNAPAGTTLSVDLQDAALKTLNITGNETVVYSAPTYLLADSTTNAGALTKVDASASQAAVNIDVSSGGTAAAPITVIGSIKADTLQVKNYDIVTGGGGNDTFVVGASTTIAAASTVTDDHAGNILQFQGLRATAFNNAPVAAATLQAGIDAAAAAGAGQVSYFVFGGDTYVVADASAANTFQAGTDFVVKLTGVHTLTGSTLVNGTVVLAG